MPDILKRNGLSPFHSGAFFRYLRLVSPLSWYEAKIFAIAQLIPLSICVMLILFLGTYASALTTIALICFFAGSVILIALVFSVLSKFLGEDSGFVVSAVAWAHTYRATALFLLLLAITHHSVALFGYTPATIPRLVNFIFLSLYAASAIWKSILTLGVLRFALGLKKGKLALAILILIPLGCAYALISAFLFGTKIPLI